MRRLVTRIVIGLVLTGATMPSARAEVTAQAVRDAINRGVAYLKRQQQADGAWPVPSPHRGGPTALCALALLNCGVEPDDPSIRRALTFLRGVPPASTYAVSLQTMVFCRAEPQRDLALIRRNVRWLEKTQVPHGPTRGAWSYPALRGLGGDNSNSQFAVLALHEAERIGVQVEHQTWRMAKEYWEHCQYANGSWGYQLAPRGMPMASGTGSMTCAGISSLVIANDALGATDARVQGGRILCCQPRKSRDEPVQRGLKWLGDHFSVSQNPGGSSAWHLYYLYGMERTGRLTNCRFIGGHDWYREGADRLLQMKGLLATSWGGQGGSESNECLATSFALLFLSKGRWPVLISKLKHGSGNDWNLHRHDVGNLTRYTELKWNRDLIWQEIDLPAATVDDLVQSPVLYYCGSENPLPEDSAAQQDLAQKLRGYLDRGGFLVAENCCGKDAFDAGFRKLIEKVFPEPEYRLQRIDPEHPIWRAEEPIPPKSLQNLPPLLGIEFGCRTSVVYAPDTQDEKRHPLSCLWELSRPGRETEYPASVQKQIAAGLSLGINILAYATNRELQNKEAFFVSPAAKAPDKGAARGTLYVPSLLHPGGCKAAPRALTNLLQAAAEQLKLRVHLEPRDLSITDPTLFDYHILFVHGRNRFTLTEAERKQLRTFLERGGMIFANAICASKAFADSFRREMQLVWPEQPLKPIPPKDPIWTGSFGGFDLATVTRRDPQGGGAKEPLRALSRKVPPELEAIKIGEHYAVIFSPYDLSCALEKQDTMQCQGYTRQDAARIGLNVLLYSLQQ